MFFYGSPRWLRCGKPSLAGLSASGGLEFVVFWADTSSHCVAHWVPSICLHLTWAQLQSPKFSCNQLLFWSCVVVLLPPPQIAITSWGSICYLSLLARCRGSDCALAMHDAAGGRHLMRMVIPCMVDSSQSTAFWHNVMSKRDVQSRPYRFCKC